MMQAAMDAARMEAEVALKLDRILAHAPDGGATAIDCLQEAVANDIELYRASALKERGLLSQMNWI